MFYILLYERGGECGGVGFGKRVGCRRCWW